MNSKAAVKVAVLVLGMHRSGTSLLGGILEKLGCQGAQTKMGPNQWNAKGYFESPEIMKLNDDVLDALGSRWDDWSPLHPGWHRSPRFSEFRARIAELMAAEYGSASLIYLKDPRICRLLPLWREALTEAGYGLACIHTHRNPLDVTRSLQVRTGVEVDPGIGMLLWLRHVLDTEAGSRGLPRIFTSYSRILSNWTEFSDQAERTFGFSWPLIAQARDARVQEIIDPVLRHYDTPVDAFLNNSATPELAKDCLRVLEAWAKNGEDEAGRETMAAVRERFDQSSELFARPLAELATKRQQMRSLEASHMAEQEPAKRHEINVALRDELEAQQRTFCEQEASLRKELIQANTCLTQVQEEAEAEQAKLQAELNAFADKVIERDQTAAALRKELGQANTRLAQVREEAEAQQAKLQAELKASADKVIERDQTAAALRKELGQANTRLAQVREEAEAQQAKLQAELKASADKVIERDQTAAALRKELGQANTRLAQVWEEAEAQQAKLQAELNAFADKVIGRDKTAAALRKELSQANARLTQVREKAEAQRHKISSSYTREIQKLHRTYQSSTSWKCSAPIRAIGRLLKGKRRHVS
ncbi:hypothetical protein ACFSYD_25360 [Paracoccus aerius]